MRIESVTIAGFRCFGPEPTKVAISPEITAIVGTNGAGKTAFLQALTKLFGVTRAQRTIQLSDFHLGAGSNPDDREKRTLFIDVLIGLPELIDGTATPETIAPTFRHMLVERKDEHPVCRIRLEANWEDDGTVEGEVTQELVWVETLDPVPAVDKRHPLSALDRGLIQLYYTPASRDATAQIKATTGALASRLLRAIEWSDETEEAVRETTTNLATAFEDETAIAAIGKAIQKRWSSLHDDDVDQKPKLSLVSRRFEEVVNKIAVIFQLGPDGHERGLDALSDGQRSLFYFALAAAVFDLEREIVQGTVIGFRHDSLRSPSLTIFALEEPENHLSPYYLARIIEQVRSLTDERSAQVVITSHSPGVLSRVKPHEVRYCRYTPLTRTSTIKRITLPPKSDEAGKFVRGAMLAYPELYFARFVLLVEGDSERIVLPILADALDLLIDPAFVAIVPLGGRHVHHFWRLLSELGIPYATLLDLDLGRGGGGFGRVKTAIQQLIGIGAPKPILLAASGGVLSDSDLAAMHGWDEQYLDGWIDHLKQFGVYYSAPLDLDLAMLQAFPTAYEAIIPPGGGPELTVEKATEVVLGVAGSGIASYGGDYKVYPHMFPAYRYHFLTNSKPATHLAALTHIKKAEAQCEMPPVLKDLLKHIAKSLKKD